MALAPKMGADADSLASYPELMREYEEARAKLAAMGLAMPSGGGDQETRSAMEAAARAGGVEGEEEDDYEMDVVPLDAAVEDAEYQGNTTSSGSRISRFKASLAHNDPQTTSWKTCSHPPKTSVNPNPLPARNQQPSTWTVVLPTTMPRYTHDDHPLPRARPIPQERRPGRRQDWPRRVGRGRERRGRRQGRDGHAQSAREAGVERRSIRRRRSG